MKYNIFVNCGGNLMEFKSNSDAKNFFLECMNCCEGSERERYTTIYLELQNSNCRFASDHSSQIYRTSIDLEQLNIKDYNELKKNYDLTDEDINYIQANYKLGKISKRIFNSDIRKYNNDFEEYYNNQPECNKVDKYYLIDSDTNKIICFDYRLPEYFCEEFELKDYNYAYKWLNDEIEYDEYLNKDKDDMEI